MGEKLVGHELQRGAQVRTAIQKYPQGIGLCDNKN